MDTHVLVIWDGWKNDRAMVLLWFQKDAMQMQMQI